MRRLGIVLGAIVGLVVVSIAGLWLSGYGLLIGSRSVYPTDDLKPWDEYLMVERKGEPTVRCNYWFGLGAVERYLAARQPTGSGETVCPALMKL